MNTSTIMVDMVAIVPADGKYHLTILRWYADDTSCFAFTFASREDRDAFLVLLQRVKEIDID